jgi:hypothetical protein
VGRRPRWSYALGASQIGSSTFRAENSVTCLNSPSSTVAEATDVVVPGTYDVVVSGASVVVVSGATVVVVSGATVVVVSGATVVVVVPLLQAVRAKMPMSNTTAANTHTHLRTFVLILLLL